jgi:hypothetical protein
MACHRDSDCLVGGCTGGSCLVSNWIMGSIMIGAIIFTAIVCMFIHYFHRERDIKATGVESNI